MLDNFSSSAQRMIVKAEELAKELHHSSVGSEHLLLAILFFEDNLLSKELNIYGVKYRGFFDKIKHLYEKEKKVQYVSYSLELKEVLEESIKVSHKYKENLVSLDILSLSLITLDNTATELLENSAVNLNLIVKKFLSITRKKSDLHTLSDLHLLGTNNKDPLIGRDNEIIQLIYALSRRNKPNAILIGEPGVGKTAIVEELAKRLINNEVPLLKNKLIYELDLASTVSGTKYRGEFEDKLKKIIKKVKEDGNAILFIDEIHNVIKAGGAEGAIDASNILKPYLARGEIQLIGATTLEEFNDSFDKDKALKRRFQIIDVNESTKEETINILRKIKSIYEDYYSLDIEDSLLEEIVDLSSKYLLTQRFPDKAIELLDNSCVSASKYLTRENIIHTMNKLYGIVVNDEEKIEKLKYLFHQEIIGLEYTKDKLINLFTNNKINSLLFIGGKGTGKAKCSELISKALYNDNLINIKCENYNDVFAINRLTSSGFSSSGEQSSILVKNLKERPNSVVLIENFELANNEFKSFFQSILEKGFFLDSKGNMISTINTLFIFSYNENEQSEYKFKFKGETIVRDNKDEIISKLGYSLYSLFDEVVCFDKLKENEYNELALRYLNKKEQNLFEISDLPEFSKKEVESSGGDAIIYKVKEFIKNKKIKNI